MHRPDSKPRPLRSRPRDTDAPARPLQNALSPWVRLRSFTNHPLIYQRMIAEADPAARPGDVVNVYERGGAFFGRGLFNPRSQIALRMLAQGDVAIDDTFWRERLARAVALRTSLRLHEVTGAWRVVHAEGDGLPGLIVERYADCLVFELFSLGMFQRVELFARLLGELLGPPYSLDRPPQTDSLASPERPDPSAKAWRVAVRADERIEQIEGFRASDAALSIDQPVTIREHGVRYRVDVAAGHKTGFFCDQRDNRRRFAVLCRDADVLDLCSYTGGFGLCAKVLGGAREVTSVDLDEAALEMAKKNANLNQVRVNHVHADAFTWLRQMIANKRQFDCVVCDPPKFAPTRDDVDDAERKYSDLNTLAMQVVRPGGVLLTCSCSGLVSMEKFTEIITGAARRVRQPVQLFDRTGAAADHPVMLGVPESEYLKALWCRML